MTSLCAPAARRRDIDALELYASAIDTSDYVAALAPLVRRAAPEIGRLLDVGAGGGQFGAALRDPELPWTAIEPSPTEQPEAFLARCLAWARRNVVWVVPAHAGPRSLCFAGCLPSGIDIDIVMQGLALSSRPHHVAFADWTFSGVVKDLDRLSAHLADRLGWAARDLRRAELKRHLVARVRPDAAGARLDIARKSAVLFWGSR